MSNEYAGQYDHEAVSAIHDHGLDIWNEAGPEIWLAATQNDADNPCGDDPGIQHGCVTRVLKNIAICENHYEPGSIGLVRMNSVGGDWTQGIALYTAFRYSSLKWVFLNYAEARSMSSIIFLAGARRVMMPDTKFMFHTGTMGVECTGTQFRTEYREWELSHDRMMEIYCDAMTTPGAAFSKASDGARKSWLTDQMQRHEDVYLTAQKAVEYGFADYVFDGDWNTIRDLSTPKR